MKEEVRDRLILFRRECFSVLSEHFLGKRKPRGSGPDAYERWSYKLAVEARMLGGVRAGVQMWVMRGLPVPPALQEVFNQIDMFNTSSKGKAEPEIVQIEAPANDPDEKK